MSTYKEDNKNYLAGSAESELNALLNELAERERSHAPAGLEAGVLDAIGAQIAPTPLPIADTQREGVWFAKTLRYAAAAMVIFGVGIGAMLVRPWESPSGMDTNASVLAVTLEADVESLLALDRLETELDESVAELSIWAHTLDTDLDDPWMALDLMSSSLDQNGAL